jgi:hypothetical protein
VNILIISMLTSIAMSLVKTLDNIATLCYCGDVVKFCQVSVQHGLFASMRYILLIITSSGIAFDGAIGKL